MSTSMKKFGLKLNLLAGMDGKSVSLLRQSGDSETAKAFNAGSDARLLGLPNQQPPYDDKEMQAAWLYGWRDVNLYWGKSAKWPVMKLPPIISLEEEKLCTIGPDRTMK